MCSLCHLTKMAMCSPPFAVRDFHYQDCHFHSIAHLMCYRYAVLSDLKLLATCVRKWSKHLTEFPIVRFVTHNWQTLCRSILGDIYSHLCLNDATFSEALVNTGPRPFVLHCQTPQGGHTEWHIDHYTCGFGGGKINVYTVDAASS